MADPIVLEQDGFGLNKAARLKAERQKEITAGQPAPLDPDFPYRVQPFDPLFFDAWDEHPAADGSGG